MPRITCRTLGAIWMRAAANAAGYTPQTAKPLAIAYANAQLVAGWDAYEYDSVLLRFGGLCFAEPVSGRIDVQHRTATGALYERDVVMAFADPQHHHRLFHRAIDVAETWSIQAIDDTPAAWDRFIASWGERRTVSPGIAAELIGGLVR